MELLQIIMKEPSYSFFLIKPPPHSHHPNHPPTHMTTCPSTSPAGLWEAQFSSVQLLSRVWLFVIPRTAACQASLSITNSQSLIKLMSIESVIQPSHLLSSPLPLLSIFPTFRVFSNESALHSRWPKYWNFSFNISPSNEYSGLISFRTAWFDLLAGQGTVKSLLQHHSSKASVLWCFMVQLSHPYMIIGKKKKTIPLTIQTFVGNASAF